LCAVGRKYAYTPSILVLEIKQIRQKAFALVLFVVTAVMFVVGVIGLRGRVVAVRAVQVALGELALRVQSAR
jgi:hypothetical protein